MQALSPDVDADVPRPSRRRARRAYRRPVRAAARAAVRRNARGHAVVRRRPSGPRGVRTRDRAAGRERDSVGRELRHWQYPIWAWHWARPDELPWPRMARLALDRRSKQRQGGSNRRAPLAAHRVVGRAGRRAGRCAARPHPFRSRMRGVRRRCFGSCRAGHLFRRALCRVAGPVGIVGAVLRAPQARGRHGQPAARTVRPRVRARLRHRRAHDAPGRTDARKSWRGTAPQPPSGKLAAARPTERARSPSPNTASPTTGQQGASTWSCSARSPITARIWAGSPTGSQHR